MSYLFAREGVVYRELNTAFDAHVLFGDLSYDLADKLVLRVLMDLVGRRRGGRYSVSGV